MNRKTICQAKRIISIAEEQSNSNLYMVIDFVLLDTLINLNNVQYSENFILNIADNSELYAGIPLKVDYNKLIAGKTDKLTHNFDPKTKRLKNQMIGSFFKFYQQNNEEGILELCGQVRIPKEFEEACNIIQQLYDDENLNVSYEIIVGESTKNGKVTFVDSSDENYLFAYSIVSNPAVTSATAFALVGELIETQINSIMEGGENLQRNKDTFTSEDMFENSKINLAELDICQVKTKLFVQLKEKMQDDYWRYDSQDIGVDYVILVNYETADLIKVEFNVSNNEVNITDIYDVDKTYTRKTNTNIKENGKMTIAELEILVAAKDEEIKSKDAKLKEKDTELENTKKDAKSKDEEKEKEVAAAKDETKTKCAELAEVNEKLTTLSASVIEKDLALAELAPIKEAFELAETTRVAAELAEKKVVLKAKYSKLLNEKVMAEVEIAEALDKLDEAKLNSRIVEIAMASTVKPTKPDVSLASRITDSVKIAGGAEPGSLQEKYSI